MSFGVVVLAYDHDLSIPPLDLEQIRLFLPKPRLNTSFQSLSQPLDC